MGYFIKKLEWKKSFPKWKIQYVSYKSKDIKNSKAVHPKKTWDVEKDRWRALGFSKTMSIEDAKVRAKQLNTIKNQLTQEERVQKNKKLTNILTSKLPIEFVEEFEKRFVTKTFLSADRKYNSNRALRLWKAAQKLIVSIEHEPSEWYYNIYDFYDYFRDRKLSIRYMNEILKFTNLWGFFICKKMARPFLQVPRPGGYERRRILDAYFEKREKYNKVSAPICSELLKKLKGEIREDIYNWIYLTVWFGLRPKEVDNLHDQSLWRVEKMFNGREVLWVYQTKVIALPEEDKWKPIPILYNEQKYGLQILKSDIYKRPLVKTIRQYFGNDVFLYGGRKAFTDLMLSKGNTLENISVWMGHSTINRTWKSYKNRRKYHLQYGT